MHAFNKGINQCCFVAFFFLNKLKDLKKHKRKVVLTHWPFADKQTRPINDESSK
jgi:hypothetical protein